MVMPCGVNASTPAIWGGKYEGRALVEAPKRGAIAQTVERDPHKVCQPVVRSHLAPPEILVRLTTGHRAGARGNGRFKSAHEATEYEFGLFV